MPDRRAFTARKSKGYGVIMDPDGRNVEMDFLQCVHCQAVWQVQPGSGRERGFCMRCNGPTCGPECSGKRVPWEQMLKNWETGKPDDFMPVQAAFANNPITKKEPPKIWVPGDP